VKAVDANILARYILGDDPEQARRATVVMAQPCYVALTVLLETAWLLSSRYRMDRETLAATLTEVIMLPTVTIDDPVLIGWAIERFAAGADFADMIHIVASRQADAFVSLDEKLAQRAGDRSPVVVECPA
jgi:predicted nucleic-acid-binding protein